MLNDINQEATKVLIRYSSQLIKASFFGADNLRSLYTDNLNLHCLCGYINSLTYDEGGYYMGITNVPDQEVNYVRSMIQFYNNREEYDVSDAPAYETGITTPTEDIVLNYRAGSQVVTAGSNTVVFKVNNVSTPFATDQYIVHAWNIGADGSMQNNVVITNKVAAGFTASDIMDAGTLYYEAVLIT